MWKDIIMCKFNNCNRKHKLSYFNRQDIIDMIDNKNQCIIIANSTVYNVTEYVDKHPGGRRCLIDKSQKLMDCSSDFYFHGKSGKKLWEKYKIGLLK